MSGKRIQEFEALRGLAILLLLALHAGIFTPDLFGEAFRNLGQFVASFLLGAFFFLAGYFAEASIAKDNNAWKFVKSKIIRIFPPYWFGLFLFVVVMEYTLRLRDLAVYILNVQAIFSPTFVKPLLTLWYISMLIVFYLLYGGVLLTTRSTRWLIAVSFFIFFAALALNLSQGFFDPRFFQYFFIFLAGVLFCRFALAREKIFQVNVFVKIFLAVASVFLFEWTLDSNYAPTNFVFIFSALFFMASWILLTLSAFQTRMGSWRLWAWLSTASFFAYLIHRPLWRILDDAFGLLPGFRTMYIHLTLGAVAALILGYLFQRGYDYLLGALRLK
ncbi:MAG: acyltransferase [Anaerolineales bacterium]|nr:acyltransferase [Anaerolineales bacterium]